MQKSLLFFFSLLLITGCRGPETIVVQTEPLKPVPYQADTTSGDGEKAFVQVRLGETAPVESLDPLFASHNSELRLVNLIYDGLVDLDESGNIAPAIARRWQANDDSTQFTFVLNTKIKYHRSRIFGGNAERTVKAEDVKFVFERMASALVPEDAAEMFRHIRGFEEYKNEQQFVKNPAKRILKGVSGIMVHNDSTVTFILKKPDLLFLEKLVHPFASIYPRELFQNNTPPLQEAVGTGAFYFIRKDGNTYLLAPNPDYYKNIPQINRLDITAGIVEKELFQQFARRELDVIVEPGPSLLNTVADSSGELAVSYGDEFVLEKTGLQTTYTFYFNPESEKQHQVQQFFELADFDLLEKTAAIYKISLQEPVQDTAAVVDTLSGIIFTQTNHPAERYFINQLALQLSGTDLSIAMNQSYAMSDEITFSTRKFKGAVPVLTWQVPVYILKHPTVSGIEVQHFAWNLNLSRISVEGGS